MKKIKPELTLEEAWGFDGLMATSAFRYCLGRQTYIVGACVDWLISNWEKFPQNVKTLIERELEEEFVRDDEARSFSLSQMVPLRGGAHVLQGRYIFLHHFRLIRVRGRGSEI